MLFVHLTIFVLLSFVVAVLTWWQVNRCIVEQADPVDGTLWFCLGCWMLVPYSGCVAYHLAAPVLGAERSENIGLGTFVMCMVVAIPFEDWLGRRIKAICEDDLFSNLQ